MAGVPFEHLEGVATRGAARLGRELLAQRCLLATAKAQAEALLGSRASGLSAEESRAYRAALQSGIAPGGMIRPVPAEIKKCVAVAAETKRLEESLTQILPGELDKARRALAASSCAILPDYLVFGAGEFRDRLAEMSAAGGELPPRNSRTRERERHLLLYLQRVCGKNDTFSAFGPSAWGTTESAQAVLEIEPRANAAHRSVFLERWASSALAAALNQDSEARWEFAPRLHPHGRLVGDFFVLADSGERIALTAEQKALLERCDGVTPAHSLGEVGSLLEELARQRVILWECEVPALAPDAFEILREDIWRWREGATRTRWQERVEAIGVLPKEFAVARDPASRTGIMAAAHRLLGELGARPAAQQRSLYAAANPIAEECYRDLRFTLSEKLAEELAQEAAPWFNLWRDSYAFVADRVAAGLRGLLQTAPRQNGAVPLPAFLQHCAANKLPLTGPGMVVLAHLAFQEVKAAFREMVSARVETPEWELTADDCAFVQRRFKFEQFDGYTYPSADLQLSATSIAAIERGQYQWIVSELHPPVAVMHHAFYWSCPDKPALSTALAEAAGHRPAVHFGFFAADFTAHTTVRHMEALPELMTFVAPQRANPRWRSVSPAEVEVFIDDSSQDVGLRTLGGKQYLGSFARAWLIPLGFHPFHFGRAPHMPRLRCGKVIVQRRSWVVTLEELPGGNFTGVSRDLVLAIEQLREKKGWPRHIYIRPTEQALRRSGAEGRDKDTKPVFIDLESYLFLEIFHRWLVKAGELEVTEMLPDPDHLCWPEEDGRRTFELRTLILPRS